MSGLFLAGFWPFGAEFSPAFHPPIGTLIKRVFPERIDLKFISGRDSALAAAARAEEDVAGVSKEAARVLARVNCRAFVAKRHRVPGFDRDDGLAPFHVEVFTRESHGSASELRGFVYPVKVCGQ